MKRVLPSRVRSKKEAERLLAFNTEKHESRIEHYLDLANVALSTKKKSSLSSRSSTFPRSSIGAVPGTLQVSLKKLRNELIDANEKVPAQASALD